MTFVFLELAFEQRFRSVRRHFRESGCINHNGRIIYSAQNFIHDRPPPISTLSATRIPLRWLLQTTTYTILARCTLT